MILLGTYVSLHAIFNVGRYFLTKFIYLLSEKVSLPKKKNIFVKLIEVLLRSES